ncbi:DNA topoisomerase I [Candidatus Micrarchaeota archaeon RBG_16_36_9]|nr:MAG: DNA topoisomerase I [Candidatus Micrarchaeota archaeon RBG_16_36_9]
MVVIIIAEKPDAMNHIAEALAEKNLAKKTSKSRISYYEFIRNGEKHIVVTAVGHLFNLKQIDNSNYPNFELEWMPSFKSKKSSFSERYYKTIQEVAKNNRDYELISSCDFDNEGSLIAERIIKLIFRRNDAKRMKFSTLTKIDLVNAYENMMPHLDWENIIAGETRHYLDYFYGINTSRALMSAIKKGSKRFAILSAGRVQAPTLVLLADREMEIRNFVPQAYWQIQSLLDDVVAFYEKDKIWSREEAEKILAECKNGKAIIDNVDKNKYLQHPPVPFNITSLQTEAYRLFGFSPQYTMSIAQKLYTSAMISYPRTSSEKVPEQLGYRTIIESLSRIKNYERLCKKLLMIPKLRPVEGKKIDPAHYAIVPTQEVPSDISHLSISARKIYDLVCRRFLSLFAKDAVKEVTQIVFDINGYKFLANGRRVLEKGWMEFYGPYSRFDEVILPDLKKGDELEVKKLEILDKETLPPSRYSQASIIKEMEALGLGTRATRSSILQTLYDRNYIVDRNIHVTDLGLKMALVIKKYVPDFADEKLTRSFEQELEEIIKGKGNKEKILNKAKIAVTKICNEFKQNEEDIGKELGEAIIQTQDNQSILGTCSKCGKDLKILYSPKTRKHFVGCTGYKDGCKNSYPLPHNALFKKLDKICDKCNTPMIQVIRRGKRPFNMCLDPKCETKADWGKTRKTKTVQQ